MTAVSVARVLDRVVAAITSYHGLLVQLGAFVAIALVVYAVGRLAVVPPLVRAVRARNDENRTLVDATELYARVAIAATALVLATAAAGFGRAFQGSALVVAAATLALGVAGQDVIGNLVSGVFLVADPDFSVGDYVQWGDQEGTVEKVDFRVTRVRTAAGETVTVPNSQLTTNALISPYAGATYRVSETFGVRHDADVETALRLPKEAAEADERIVADPEPTVQVDGFGANSLDVVARYWVGEPTETLIAEVRSAYVRRVADAFEAHDIAPNPASRTDSRVRSRSLTPGRKHATTTVVCRSDTEIRERPGLSSCTGKYRACRTASTPRANSRRTARTTGGPTPTTRVGSGGFRRSPTPSRVRPRDEVSCWRRSGSRPSSPTPPSGNASGSSSSRTASR
ncbi:small-conductance mechanosensitive channel [Halarchaeum solikamskense]|nr:small-conductance mechanosensitive channel [Halarchaeum solikamskense]